MIVDSKNSRSIAALTNYRGPFNSFISKTKLRRGRGGRRTQLVIVGRGRVRGQNVLVLGKKPWT